MDSSDQLPPPSSYPGAPRRRASSDARAAAYLSGVVALLSVLVMAVVGEIRLEEERGRAGRKRRKREASVFFSPSSSLSPPNPQTQKPKTKNTKNQVPRSRS